MTPRRPVGRPIGRASYATPRPAGAGRRRARRDGREGGDRRAFTLLELLVALAMVSILAASLFTCLAAAFRARDSAEAALDLPRTSELAFETLRNDLEAALPPSGVLAGAFEGTTGGDSDDLIFFANSEGPRHISGTGEIKQIELTISADPRTNERVLVRRVTGNLLAQVAVDPDEEVICRGVSGFSVQYYDGADWQTTWDSTQQNNSLPLAVQVTLTLDRPGAVARGKTVQYVRIFQMSCSTLQGQGSGAAGGGTF